MMRETGRRILASSFLTLALTGIAEADGPATPESLFQEGQELLASKDCSGAIKVFRKAEKLSPQPGFDLLNGLVRAYTCFGAWKDAEIYARRAIEATAEPVQKAEALNRLGQTLFRNGSGTAEQVAAAVEAFRQALAVSEGKFALARYNLAMALLKQGGRDEEGVALLKEFVAAWPDAPGADHARSLIANPQRARVPMMPDFEIVTVDGSYLTTEDLRGKVVLLDFWATWCAPCRQAVPALARWHHSLASEAFVILSVTSERNREAVQKYITKEGMSWPQFVDAKGAFDQQFDVSSLPTYVLVDHNGVIIHRASGWSSCVQGDLSRRITQAIKEAKKASAATATSGD